MRDALLVIRIWFVRVGFAIGSRRPILREVVLATGHADAIGGNLAAIRAELARSAPELPVRVIAHRPSGGIVGRLRALLHGMRAGYRLARSRLVVLDDYFFPLYVLTPRPGTTVVQAWHASGAFKKFGYSLSGKGFGADATLLRRVRIHSNYDLCLVSSERFASHYAEAFGLPLERFTSRIGVPRTDPLFDEGWRIGAEAAVRSRYAVPAGKRIILHAPTFRGERVTRARHPEALDLHHLREALGDDHVLLLRLHPFVRERVALEASLGGFVIDASAHPDIHELMIVADVLITDYSSAIYEFSLLGRPMAFFAPDRADYERERGFYFDYAGGVPGPVFESTPPLAEYLRAGEFDTGRVRRFAAESFDVADGYASRRFVDEIVRPALDGGR